MRKKTIVVPQEDEINAWIAFLELNRFENNSGFDKILVDYNTGSFFKPYHLTSLACLIEGYFINGIDIEFLPCASKVCQYLDSFGFAGYWDRNLPRKLDFNRGRRSLLALAKLSRPLISSYTISMQEYYQNNYLQDKDLDPLSIAISEMLNNVFDHSQSKVEGFTLSQYYPRKKEIIISVCDFGLGIPTTINNHLVKSDQPAISNEKATLAAFERDIQFCQFRIMEV